jgi:hypothetical protein
VRYVYAAGITWPEQCLSPHRPALLSAIFFCFYLVLFSRASRQESVRALQSGPRPERLFGVLLPHRFRQETRLMSDDLIVQFRCFIAESASARVTLLRHRRQADGVGGQGFAGAKTPPGDAHSCLARDLVARRPCRLQAVQVHIGDTQWEGVLAFQRSSPAASAALRPAPASASHAVRFSGRGCCVSRARAG